MADIQTPPTEIELADALLWLRAVPSKQANVIRRLAFERDRLRAELAKCHEDYKTQVNAIVARDDEIDRLTAIENALPITADGVRIVPLPPTIVYRRITYHGRREIQASTGFAWGTATFDAIGDGEPSCGHVGRNVALCFSTREAAEANP